MGLMYIFPITDNKDEGDRAEIKNDSIILRTYGLPMIFWGYLLAALSVVFLMWLASKDVIEKLIAYEDPSMHYLGQMVKWTIILSPIIATAFFFYEKVITKKDNKLSLTYKVFFIPFFKKNYELKSKDAFSVNHYMDSPNMAKLRRQQGLESDEALKHFENKGYFELSLINQNEKRISIDRHSRKVDLLKLKDLLSRY